MSNKPPTPTQNNNDQDSQINDMPKAPYWDSIDIFQWEGFWFDREVIKAGMTFRSRFQARDDDVLLASPMKTGTTWLKSLTLCIFQQITENNNNNDILTTESPHFHVPTIEFTGFTTKELGVDLYDSSAPRLLHTHLPYTVLPDSIKNSNCRIVFIARNPKDTLISTWHFVSSVFKTNGREPYPLEKAIDSFCNGVHEFGPFFDLVLEFWLESQKRPEKILFLKYEELKSDPKGQVTRLAEFLGRPIKNEEDVDEILKRCSLERLKNLEVNKNGTIVQHVPNSFYFRKGVVGDWKNYLTPEMEERINQASRVKLEPFGLFL